MIPLILVPQLRNDTRQIPISDSLHCKVLNPFSSEFQPEKIILHPSWCGFCCQPGHSNHLSVGNRQRGEVPRDPHSITHTQSRSRNSLAQTRTKEFPAPFPYPSLQLGGKWNIPAVLSPGMTFNEFHVEKEEMVHITVLGLDPSRYSFKWQERLPFHGNSGCDIASHNTMNKYY